MIWGILVLVMATALVAVTVTFGIITGWLVGEYTAKLIAHLRDKPDEQDIDE